MSIGVRNAGALVAEGVTLVLLTHIAASTYGLLHVRRNLSWNRQGWFTGVSLPVILGVRSFELDWLCFLTEVLVLARTVAHHVHLS